MHCESLRRVDSQRMIRFQGKIFKVLAPCVQPLDLVVVLPSDQGVLLYCEGARVVLPYIQIIPSNIAASRANPRTCRDRICRKVSNGKR